MNVLALDTGTLTGWAAWSNGQLTSGVWDLKPNKTLDRTRQLVLTRRLQQVTEELQINRIAYETVMSHGRPGSKKVQCPTCHTSHNVRITQTNTQAAHVYGALSGMVEWWADMQRMPEPMTVHVSTLKKFATGDGRATKQAMIAMAEMRWREQKIQDDNQADALHVLDWAMVQLKIAPKAVIDCRGRKV